MTAGRGPSIRGGADERPDPTFRSFVPRLTVELAEERGNVCSRIDGSMLSADISGFTALSERLARRGKEGAEELRRLINTCFGSLMQAAYGFDGEVLKFGGDALLVLFRGDRHRSRAANAALAMQLALRTSAAATRARLTMTVGVGDGPFDVFLVGTRRRELLISGNRADEVIRLESEAAAGTTLVSAAIAASLTDEAVHIEHAGGFQLVDPTGRISERPVDENFSGLIPPAVRAHALGLDRFGGEHRPVCVGFVALRDLAGVLDRLGPELTARELGRFVDHVDAVAENHGVAALETDIAQDGLKFVLAAGAPVATASNADALLQTGLSVLELSSPFGLRVGVQAGRVFAGFVGTAHRRTYTVMGDPTNTAARMLTAARDGDVVAVATVLDETREGYEVEALEPFHVKGKAEPITACRVLANRRDPAVRRTAHIGVLGRTEELGALQRAVDERAIVELTGPAGIGKTQLVDALLEQAGERVVVRISCTPFGADSPYLAARPALRRAFGVDVDAPADAAGAQLTAFVSQHLGEHRPLVPLLAVPIGAAVDLTAEARAIEARFWRTRSHAILVDALAQTVGEDPIVIVEDVQWIDDSSRELLDVVLASDRLPWPVVITERREEARREDAGAGVQRVHLGPLSADAVRELAITTSPRPLTDAELRVIAERSGANPLFVVELSRAIGGGAGEELPTSIETVIASRIDRLPAETRRCLRTASVFGPTVDPGDLDRLVDESAATHLGPAIDAGLVHVDRSGRLAFTHALHREVAYEALPFRVRRRLHRRVVGILEAQSDPPAELLSLHCSLAGDTRGTWEYGRIAGRRAVDQHAHDEAITTLERALQHSARRADVSAEDRAEVALLLGDSAETAGHYERARWAYRLVARLVPEGHPLRSLVHRRNGVLAERQGHYGAAIRWYRRGQRDESLADDERAELVLAEAGVRFRQGRVRDCFDLARPVADRSDLPDSIRLHALYLLQLSGTYLPEVDATEFGDRALRLTDRVDDPVLIGNLHNNLGIAAYYAGRWDDAVDLYRRSHGLRHASGDVTGALMAVNNIGEVRSDQWRLDEAVELFTDALRQAEAAGYEMAIGVLHANLGRVEVRRGHADDARAQLDLASEIFERLGAASFDIETRLRRAELAVVEGRYDDAIAQARALLDDPTTPAGGEAAEVGVRRVLGIGLRETGDADAVTVLADAVDRARRADLRFELALALEQFADDPTDEAAREARALFDALGVVRPTRLSDHGARRSGSSGHGA